MIDAYSWRTSNGRKLHIVLEELGLKYRIHPTDIRKGDQFEPEFLKITPTTASRVLLPLHAISI